MTKYYHAKKLKSIIFQLESFKVFCRTCMGVKAEQKLAFIIQELRYRLPTKVVVDTKRLFPYLCPNCGGILPVEYRLHCTECGQKLNWHALELQQDNDKDNAA